MARPISPINAGTMADIAFLLLIFFLVTTTMDVNQGINRLLPPIPEEDAEIPPIRQRNVLEVLVNSADQLLVNKRFMEIGDLRNEAIEFFSNPYFSDDLPEMTPLTERMETSLSRGDTARYRQLRRAYETLGDDVMMSRGVISLQNDRGTSYNMYIRVQDELTRAITAVRDDLTLRLWGVRFSDMREETDSDRILAVQTVIPAAISEAEPVNIGGR
jgi:hypothetical protein